VLRVEAECGLTPNTRHQHKYRTTSAVFTKDENRAQASTTEAYDKSNMGKIIELSVIALADGICQQNEIVKSH
jgi:hypothetical protein